MRRNIFDHQTTIKEIATEWAMDQRINKLHLTVREWQIIQEVAFYCSPAVAEHEYPFAAPVYDEDAGVYTDYGVNEMARTMAQIYFRDLLSGSIVDIAWPEPNEGTEYGDDGYLKMPCIGYIASKSVGAIGHLLHCLCDLDLQKSIWTQRLGHDYESDGHYTGEDRHAWIEKQVANKMIDRSVLRRLSRLMADSAYNGDCTIRGLNGQRP